MGKLPKQISLLSENFWNMGGGGIYDKQDIFYIFWANLAIKIKIVYLR